MSDVWWICQQRCWHVPVKSVKSSDDMLRVLFLPHWAFCAVLLLSSLQDIHSLEESNSAGPSPLVDYLSHRALMNINNLGDNCVTFSSFIIVQVSINSPDPNPTEMLWHGLNRATLDISGILLNYKKFVKTNGPKFVHQICNYRKHLIVGDCCQRKLYPLLNERFYFTFSSLSQESWFVTADKSMKTYSIIVCAVIVKADTIYSYFAAGHATFDQFMFN